MDPEYIISTYVQDGLLFELIVGQVEVGLVEQGEVAQIISQPRVRITKVENAPST
jgi:hypothetical protein